MVEEIEQPKLRSISERIKPAVQRVREWIRPDLFGGASLVLGILGLLNGPVPRIGGLTNFYQMISTELIGIGITVLIIDNAVELRATEREKANLILQMGSPDNAFAREAVRKLRARGWGFGNETSLHGAQISRANLQGAILLEVNFQGAWMIYADLQDAILIGANLREADLFQANMEGARLIEANLKGAKLQDANLIGTNLKGANLQDALMGWALSPDPFHRHALRWTAEQLALTKDLTDATLPDGSKYESSSELAKKIKKLRQKLEDERSFVWTGGDNDDD